MKNSFKELSSQMSEQLFVLRNGEEIAQYTLTWDNSLCDFQAAVNNHRAELMACHGSDITLY